MARLATWRRNTAHELARPSCRVTRHGLRLVTWFKVDDSFYDHPKVWDASDSAVALWVRAGSWSARNLQDGFVPSKMPARFCSDPEAAVRELLDRGLWRRTKGGYRFHDWSQWQPTRDEVIASKEGKSSGGRIGNHRRWHVARAVVDPDCPYCQGKHVSDNRSDGYRYTDGGTESGPNPPVPSRPDLSQSPSGFDFREVTQSSSLSVGDARATPTDDDLKIDQTIISLLAELTGRTVSPNHAASVRQQILGGRSVQPDRRGNYVATAIRERPRDFLPAAGPVEQCPIHLLEQPCRSCAADRKAGEP